MGFSRQEYWSGLPCPSPGDLPYPGIEPRSPTLQVDSLVSEPPGKSRFHRQLLIANVIMTLSIIINMWAYISYLNMWMQCKLTSKSFFQILLLCLEDMRCQNKLCARADGRALGSHDSSSFQLHSQWNHSGSLTSSGVGVTEIGRLYKSVLQPRLLLGGDCLTFTSLHWISLLSFSSSVTSNSLWPQGLKHASLPCPFLSTRLLKLMSAGSVMSSKQLILCHPLLCLPSTSTRVFSNE